MSRQRLLHRLLSAGATDFPPATLRRLTIVNLMGYLIFFASLNYAVIYALADFEKYRAFILINLLLSVFGLLVPAMHRFGDNAAGLFIVAFEYPGLFCLTALLGRDSGIPINYIIGAAVPFLAFDRAKLPLIFSVASAGFALHLAAWFLFPADAAIIQAEPLLIANIYISSAVTVFGLTAAIIHYALLLKERAEARTEELLGNILPGSIAERLKADPSANIAELYSEATVMFADTVGYTTMSLEMGPTRTVALLNDIFTAFDELVERHGVEKIKTVGDAYMVVGGVPEPASDHTRRIVSMALSLRNAVSAIGARHGVPIEVRVGIATGPLIGGVIGRRKLLFDVWGDAVNLAARLQTSGAPGKIHVSAAVAEAVCDRFDVEQRHVMELKGFGQVETCCIVGEKSAKAGTFSLAEAVTS